MFIPSYNYFKNKPKDKSLDTEVLTRYKWYEMVALLKTISKTESLYKEEIEKLLKQTAENL